MALKGNPAEWSANDRQGVIRDALLAVGSHAHVPGTQDGKRKCTVCRSAARSLFDRVGSAPLIYLSRGEVLPKGKERWSRFMNNVGEVHAYVASEEWLSEPSETPEMPEDDFPAEAPEETPEAPSETPEMLPEVPEVPEVPEEREPNREERRGYRREAERFYKAVQAHRAFVRTRKDVESLDSMRIVIDGTRAIMVGVPVDALISAITAPWTSETRRHAAAYRPSESELEPPIPEGTYNYAAFAPRPSKFSHATSEYVARLVFANVPVWLHGPAGTGKSSAAKYAASRAVYTVGPMTGQPLEYYEVNLSGAMTSAITGKDRLKEFVESEAMQAFEHGGLLCLEEFSGAHPSVGTALNTMLATAVGSTYSNSAAGRKYVRHPDFRVVVTDNSLGYGSAEFKRSALDAATIDRFRAGRVYQGLDLGLERAIFESIIGV